MSQWTTHNEEYEAIHGQMEKVANANGYILNPDIERREKVLGLMTENFVATGKHFCPCKQSHPLNPDKDVICPCPEFHGEIERDGQCFCRLFFKRA